MGTSAPYAIPVAAYSGAVVDAQPAPPLHEPEPPRESPLDLLYDVFTSQALLVTGISSGVHLLLVLVLALLHFDATTTRRPPVLTASVKEREPPRPDLRDVQPVMEQPSLAAGPLVRAFTVPTAPQPVPLNVGYRPVARTLPGLNEMIFRDAVKTGGSGGIDNVSFFGSASYSKRVVFVVDNSMSMRGKKFERCKEELLTAVSNLSTRQQFYVVFFSDKEHAMLEPNSPKDAVNLDTKTWESFHNWVDELELKRGTRAKGALKKAFELKPDVIYLLTDGQFTDDAFDYLMDLGETKVRINTIGFQANDKGMEVLHNIARKFKGEYTSIRR